MVANKKKNRLAAVEGLFTWPSEKPQLIGSRCKSCKNYSFPKTFTCQNPQCKEKEVEEVFLSRKGKLWSYTIVYYPPPPPFKVPEPFSPFGIGVVELPEGIRVLGMLTNCDLNALKMDMAVELVVEKIYGDEANEYVGWKFQPVQK